MRILLFLLCCLCHISDTPEFAIEICALNSPTTCLPCDNMMEEFSWNSSLLWGSVSNIAKGCREHHNSKNVFPREKLASKKKIRHSAITSMASKLLTTIQVSAGIVQWSNDNWQPHKFSLTTVLTISYL